MLFDGKKNKDKTGISTDKYNILSVGTSLKGDIDSDSDILVDCKVEGDVTCSGRLIVGKNGHVEGNIRSRIIEVTGKVSGNIEATELLVMCPGATVDGDIRSENLEIQQGARFTGNCGILCETITEIANNEMV